MWSLAQRSEVSAARASGLLWLLLVVACEGANIAPEPASQPVPTARTRWVPAASARESSSLEAPARVLAGPRDAATVGAPLVARIVEVRVRPGQRVRLGDPLVDVVMPDLIRAAGLLRSAQIRLEVLEQQHARLEKLLVDKLAVTSDLVAVQGEIADARAQREDARATLRAAGQADEVASSLLEGRGVIALRAQIAGTVVAVSAQLGQLREPASGPLIELAAEATDPQIEARFAAAPPEGAEFEWVDSNRRIPLRFEGTAPRASAQDGSKLVWLRVREGARAPEPGALGRVRLLPPGEWVVVPARALHEIAGDVHVEVRAADGETQSPVTIVQRSASEAVITGLPVGTLIAAEAAQGAGVHGP